MNTFDILQNHIPHFQISSTSVSACADRLRELGYKICTLENLGSSNTIKVSQLLELKNTTLEQLLNTIVAQNPDYRWEKVKDDLLNIFPIQSVLDDKVPDLNIRDKGAWAILEEDLEVEKMGISLFNEFGEENGPLVSLDLESADLREALNTIVSQLDKALWHISGNPGAYFLTISSIP